MSTPRKRMCPSLMNPFSGLSSPLIARSVVVLPAPLVPSSETMLPSATERLTPRSTWMMSW